MVKIFDFIGKVAIIILFLDFLCFFAWIMSGQVPQGDWYLGTITTHLLRLIF